MKYRTAFPLVVLSSDQVDPQDVTTNITEFKFAIWIAWLTPWSNWIPRSLSVGPELNYKRYTRCGSANVVVIFQSFSMTISQSRVLNQCLFPIVFAALMFWVWFVFSFHFSSSRNTQQITTLLSPQTLHFCQNKWLQPVDSGVSKPKQGSWTTITLTLHWEFMWMSLN